MDFMAERNNQPAALEIVNHFGRAYRFNCASVLAAFQKMRDDQIARGSCAQGWRIIRADGTIAIETNGRTRAIFG